MECKRPRTVRPAGGLAHWIGVDVTQRNPYIEVIDPTRLCFYCSEPAVTEYETSITSAYPDGTGMVDFLKGASPIRGKLRIVGDACEDHESALADALMDAGRGTASGRALTRNLCPDAWHTDDAAYEASQTEPTQMGDSQWYESHHECPTCGFSTSTSSIMKDSRDPAYAYATEAIQGRAGSL